MRTKLRAVLSIAAAAVVLGACSRDSRQGGGVVVGSILGLTGDNASYGVKMQRGFDIAVAEVNASGGINGDSLVLRVEDSQFDPSKAVTAYRKLTGVDGVRIIVGITGSRNAIPVVQAAKSDSVVIIDPLSSAPSLTTVAGSNYFRIMPSDALAGRYNVEWATQDGMRNPAIVYVEDDWGVSYRDALLGDLRARGLERVEAVGVTVGTRDFRSQVERIRQARPDAVFLLVYAREGAALMQQLRQAGVRARVYGSDNISTSEFAAAGAAVIEGVRVAMPAEVTGTAYEQFASRYRAQHSEAPDANVIKSYDAMMLLAHAMRRAGTDPGRIRDFLRSPGFRYTGLSGEIAFDEHGDLVGQRYARMVYASGSLAALR